MEILRVYLNMQKTQCSTHSRMLSIRMNNKSCYVVHHVSREPSDSSQIAKVGPLKVSVLVGWVKDKEEVVYLCVCTCLLAQFFSLLRNFEPPDHTYGFIHEYYLMKKECVS